jgi:hypothetical protein
VNLGDVLASHRRLMAGPVGREMTAMTPRMGVLHHGSWAGLAQGIHEHGLMPNTGHVYLAHTEGLAYGYGAWAAGMASANVSLDDLPDELLTGKVGSVVARAMDEHGLGVAAVCAVELPVGFEIEPATQNYCPALPWEAERRAAPCYRTTEHIDPCWISGWRIFPVPELNEPETLAAMTGHAELIAEEYPRGDALLEDLSPAPIGDAIPNGRRLIAAILNHADAATALAAHGPSHWARVAARGLDLHPKADTTVVLLFALLHDAVREHDGRDDGHGVRAAALARELNGVGFTLDPNRLEVLADACAGHTDGEVTGDSTVGACWMPTGSTSTDSGCASTSRCSRLPAAVSWLASPPRRRICRWSRSSAPTANGSTPGQRPRDGRRARASERGRAGPHEDGSDRNRTTVACIGQSTHHSLPLRLNRAPAGGTVVPTSKSAPASLPTTGGMALGVWLHEHRSA